MHKLYSELCKICGSKKNYLIENEGRRSLFCEDCNHYEDIYVSEELQQYWDNQAKAEEQAKQQKAQNVPKCPICGSTNLTKITVTKKAIKTGLFGIFGAIDDAGKTWKCNDCGSKF